MTPLFWQYPDKNKIPVREFFTIVTSRWDLQNYSNMSRSGNLAKFFHPHYKVRMSIWEPCLEKISRKTEYLIVNFSLSLQLDEIYKVTLICQGRGSWPNFFFPTTLSELGWKCYLWYYFLIVSRQKRNTSLWFMYYSYNWIRSSK